MGKGAARIKALVEKKVRPTCHEPLAPLLTLHTLTHLPHHFTPRRLCQLGQIDWGAGATPFASLPLL